MFRDKNDNRVVYAILPRLFKHVRRFLAHRNDIPVGEGPHRDVFAGISGIFEQRLPTAGVSTGTPAHACWPFTKETPQLVLTTQENRHRLPLPPIVYHQTVLQRVPKSRKIVFFEGYGNFCGKF